MVSTNWQTSNRNRVVMMSACVPNGTQKTNRKNGKKLFRSPAGPQANPINP